MSKNLKPASEQKGSRRPSPATCSALLEVSHNDLDILARAILENWSMTTNSGPWQSEEDRCRFCYRVAKTTDIKEHALDCPVIVAVSVAPNSD